MPKRKPPPRDQWPTGEAAYKQLAPAWRRAAEYLAQGLTDTEAHERAFPSSKANRRSRCDLMRRARSDRVGFQSAVDYLVEKASEKAQITIERVMYQLANIVEADPADSALYLRGEVEMEDIPAHARAAILSAEEKSLQTDNGKLVERKIRRETKTQAAKLLLDVLGAKTSARVTAEAMERMAEVDEAKARLAEAIGRRAAKDVDD